MADDLTPATADETSVGGQEPKDEQPSNRDFASQRITKDRDKWKAEARKRMEVEERLNADLGDAHSQLDDFKREFETVRGKHDRELKQLKQERDEFATWKKSRIDKDNRGRFVSALAEDSGVNALLLNGLLLDAADSGAVETSSPESFDEKLVGETIERLKKRAPEVFSVSPIGDGSSAGAHIDRNLSLEDQKIVNRAKRNAPRKDADVSQRRVFTTTR